MSKACLGVLLMIAALAAPHAAWAGPETAQTPTIAEKTAGAQKLAGYFNLYWDAKQGKLWLEIDKWGANFFIRAGFRQGSGRMILDWTAGSLARRALCASSAAARRCC